MRISKIKIANLTTDEGNGRKHSLRNKAAIMESLRRFGQQKPIIIDSDNVVRAGNGTLEAAKELGWDKLACLRSDLEGNELMAYAIADNRTAELAEWDMQILVEQLKELDGFDPELAYAAGFNDGELAALNAVDDGANIPDVNDPSAEWEGMPEFQQADVAHRTVVVHFINQDDLEKFSKLVGQEIGEKTKFMWFPAVERAATADQRYASSEQE